MEQSPSLEVNSFSSSHEILRSLWNPNVHYRFHNSEKIVSVLSQVSVTHELSFDLSKIYVNIIPHLYLGLPSGFFPSALPTKTLHALLFSPHVCHVPRPSHPLWFEHADNIWWAVLVMKLLIMRSSPVPVTQLLLVPRMFLGISWSGWTVRVSIPGWSRRFYLRQNPSWPSYSPTLPPPMGTGALPGGEAARAWRWPPVPI
jgi:hypothetical protein